MPETMVERIARVLEPQAWAALGTGDTLSYKNRRTSSLRKARAALQALREPEDDLLEKVSSAAFVERFRADAGPYHRTRSTINAFIDAALSEGAER